MLRFATYLFLLLSFILGVVLTILNAESVTFNYLLGQTIFPLPVLMLFAFIVGSLLTSIALFIWLIKIKHMSQQVKKENKKLTKLLQKHNIVLDYDN